MIKLLLGLIYTVIGMFVMVLIFSLSFQELLLQSCRFIPPHTTPRRAGFLVWESTEANDFVFQLAHHCGAGAAEGTNDGDRSLDRGVAAHLNRASLAHQMTTRDEKCAIMWLCIQANGALARVLLVFEESHERGLGVTHSAGVRANRAFAADRVSAFCSSKALPRIERLAHATVPPEDRPTKYKVS